MPTNHHPAYPISTNFSARRLGSLNGRGDEKIFFYQAQFQLASQSVGSGKS